MKRLDNVTEFVSGSPQFRIKEVFDDEAPIYTYYGQQDIEDDLVGIDYNDRDGKQVRTLDKVNTLCEGDVIFSLISGKSAIVGANHQGYLYTQNYVKLITNEKIDSKYLVYSADLPSSLKLTVSDWITRVSSSKIHAETNEGT